MMAMSVMKIVMGVVFLLRVKDQSKFNFGQIAPEKDFPDQKSK